MHAPPHDRRRIPPSIGPSVLASLCFGGCALLAVAEPWMKYPWKETPYRGSPGLSVCGDAWSINGGGSFVCDDADLPIGALAELTSVFRRDVRLGNVTLRKDGDWLRFPSFMPARGGEHRILERLESLSVDDMTVPEWLAERMPNVRSLYVTNSRFPFSSLAHTPLLERVYIARTEAPPVSTLASLPKLAELDLVVVARADTLAAELQRLRPDVRVRVYNH